MLHAYEHAADSFTSTPQERALHLDDWWVHRIADPAELSVVAMFVHENFRGQGLARQLMQAAVQHGMARQGLRVLQLEVTQGNVAAERLYQSMGFQPYGVEPMAVATAGGYRAKLHMWLDLLENGE